jgi:hypothetical protein
LRISDVEVCGRRATHELQGHRRVAGVGDAQNERHRLTRRGAGRCLDR